MIFGNTTKSSPTIEDFIQWLDDDYDKERKQIWGKAEGLSEEELHRTQLFNDNYELNKSYKLIRGAAEKLKQFENEWGKDEEKKSFDHCNNWLDPIAAEFDAKAKWRRGCEDKECDCWEGIVDCPNQIDDFDVDTEMEVLEVYKEEEQSISKTNL